MSNMRRRRNADALNQGIEHTRTRDERDLNAAEREKLAVTLRRQGKDFDEIAQACGYKGRNGAFYAWRRALARIPQPEADDARREMRESYTLMRRALYESVAAGKTWAIEAWLKVDERESKLLGLDAKNEPSQMGAQVYIRSYPPEWTALVPSTATAAPAIASGEGTAVS